MRLEFGFAKTAFYRPVVNHVDPLEFRETDNGIFEKESPECDARDKVGYFFVIQETISISESRCSLLFH